MKANWNIHFLNHNLWFWCFNDEHPKKALLPIEVTEEGIDISVNLVQLAKALLPIEVTEEGIIICVNDEQKEKA